MPSKQQRSPQEKKALSYGKDRRNCYGENDKASRRLVPLRKAQDHRRRRRGAAQAVGTLEALSEEAAAVLESSVRRDVERGQAWRKCADRPLRDVVRWRHEGRAARADRKQRFQFASTPVLRALQERLETIWADKSLTLRQRRLAERPIYREWRAAADA